MFRFDILFNVIPVNGSSTNVNSGGIFSRTDTGTMNDFMGITGEKLIYHSMSDVFREAHYITQLFFSISRVNSLCIYFVPERKTKDDTDVNGIPVRRWRGMSQSRAGLAWWFMTNIT
jgi:hypothetical protein